MYSKNTNSFSKKDSNFTNTERTIFKLSKSQVPSDTKVIINTQKDSEPRRAILSKLILKYKTADKSVGFYGDRVGARKEDLVFGRSWKNPRKSHFNQGKTARHTATSLLSYFVSKGKFSSREGLFTKYLSNQAITYKREKKVTPSSYLPAFIFAATPFVRLKTRRRGGGRKRIKQKLTYRPRLNGQRQAFLLFSKSLRSGVRKGKKDFFKNKFYTQREGLLQTSRRRSQVKNRSATVGNTSPISPVGVKSLRDVRDEIHLRAYQIRPRFWRRKKWKQNFKRSSK